MWLWTVVINSVLAIQKWAYGSGLAWRLVGRRPLQSQAHMTTAWEETKRKPVKEYAACRWKAMRPTRWPLNQLLQSLLHLYRVATEILWKWSLLRKAGAVNRATRCRLKRVRMKEIGLFSVPAAEELWWQGPHTYVR
mmetsp:Transcript_48358/g.96141  ORF Transcript_48358/g.96141 Transcript_48358/m.96141 type:complete len:137 (-) Transcript_48358:236-646(-)